MEKWIIPVTYTMAGHIAIEADSAEEAIRKANGHIDKCPLCNDASYLEDSYCIEEDTSLVELDTELYNKGKINIVPEMVDIETEE